MEANIEYMDMQDDILISYLLGEASPDEIKQVENWRATDDACNRRFEEFRTLWEASKNLLDGQEDDAGQALTRFREKAAARKLVDAGISGRVLTIRWLAAAASILLIAGATWLYVLGHRENEIKLITKAETETDSLPDGSVITLNHGSSFEYPSAFKGNRRLVKLTSGEAFFNVAHDKAKPFIITAGQTQITVVGTSFNVKNKNGDVEVIVETGIVEVSKNDRVVYLTPGEKALVRKGSATMEKDRSTDHLYNYYRTREFEADNTPLWRVVEVLNEAYDSHIVIERKELMNLPLNTTFKNEPLDKILDVISRTFAIKIAKKGDTILLK